MNFRLIPSTSAIVERMASQNLESVSKVYEYADLLESRLEVYKVVWRLTFFFSVLMSLSFFRIYMIIPWMCVFPMGLFFSGVIAYRLKKKQQADLDEAVQKYLKRLDSQKAFARAVKVISQDQGQSSAQSNKSTTA